MLTETFIINVFVAISMRLQVFPDMGVCVDTCIPPLQCVGVENGEGE